MSRKILNKRITRRQFVKAGVLATGAMAVLAGCKRGEPTPAAPTVAAARPGEVPRNRTLVLLWAHTGSKEGRWVDHEVWSPYALGGNPESGTSIMYEPLAFYSALADKEILWLAESYKFSSDFKELTIKTRSGIRWSDGQPFSAEDVAFTLNSLRDLGSKVRYGADVQQYMAEARATDPNTVVIKLNVPAPRFFAFLSYKFDLGVPIVPKHIFQGQDWTQFKFFDLAKGWPVTTGPWKVVIASPEQKVFDQQKDWWAAKAGLMPMPQVQRVVWRSFANDQQGLQALVTNEADYALTVQTSTLLTMMKENPKIITHSGQKPPYGYLDWWPMGVFVNHAKEPFGDKNVRWAISYFIDRKQVIDVVDLGASTAPALPMPYYPPLVPYFEAAKPLLAEYNTLEFNPKKGEERLTRSGWKKNPAGIWADAQGNTLKMPWIYNPESFGQLGPVVFEQLKRQGIEVSYTTPPDWVERLQKGEYVASFWGHGGSYRDPYEALRLFQSKTLAVPGLHGVNLTGWTNEAYDRIVDQVYATDPKDKAKLKELFVKAMEIWLPELPDIMLRDNYHRIPYNTTYWKNWPTQENPYVNGAVHHLTAQMIIWNLKPA